eukprot:scaffold80668_cov79-Cyclotella_meneghiniana.AAC.6
MDVSPKSHPRNQGVEERGVASVVFVSFPIAQQMDTVQRTRRGCLTAATGDVTRVLMAWEIGFE